MKVIFSHGKESGPWGSKITKLADVAKALNFAVDSIDYRNITSPEDRVITLNDYLNKETSPYILVGSSMGGYVSMVASKQHSAHGLFLLAPALFMPDYTQQDYQSLTNNIEIVHGWSDEVIPVENSIKYAKNQKCTLHLIDGDHRLNSSIDQVIELFTAFLKRVKWQPAR